MSAGGHMMDMARRMRDNRALLLAKREKRRKVTSAYTSDVKYSDNSLHAESNLTEIELAEVLQEIRERKSFERKSVMTKTIGVIIAMFILIMAIVFTYT